MKTYSVVLFAKGPPITSCHPDFNIKDATSLLAKYRLSRENGTDQDNPKRPFPDAGLHMVDNGAYYTWFNQEFDKELMLYKYKIGTYEEGADNAKFYQHTINANYPTDSRGNHIKQKHIFGSIGSSGVVFFQEANYEAGFPKRWPFKEYWYNFVFDEKECPDIREWMEEKDFNYLNRISKENPGLFEQELKHLKVANPNHPAILKIEAKIKGQESPFYENKIPSLSIEHLPYQMTAPASSSSSSSQPAYGLEKILTIGQELSRMGLTAADDSAFALATEFKAVQWQNKRLAHQEIFYWLAEKHAETYVTALFQSTVKGSAAPDINLIAFMMHASKSVVLFKLPFSLSSILWKEKDSDKEALRQLIYLALKRIAEEQIVSDPESKCIAMFKLLLKSALKKGMINEVQFHQLDNMAEKTAIFSDERFLALKREIEILKQQFSSLDMRIGIAEKNLQLVADSVNELKYAFQQQKERKLYLSIATFGLSCFGVPALIDAMTNVADLSDLAEIGSVVLQVPMEQSQSYLDDGLQALEQNKRAIAQQGAAKLLKGMGLDSDKFLETWMTANVILQGTPQDKQLLMASAVSTLRQALFHPAALLHPRPHLIQNPLSKKS